MVVCNQCNGKGATQAGHEMINPYTAAVVYFHKSQGSAPAAMTCSQCGGRGYY